jgi:hypothetical protein
MTKDQFLKLDEEVRCGDGQVSWRPENERGRSRNQ